MATEDRVGDADGREENPGGKKQREVGWRPMGTGPGQRAKPGGWAKGTWKRGPERTRGDDRAEECGADSGVEGVR